MLRIQVLDYGLGLRFGIQVWYSNINSCLGFRFVNQVWESGWDSGLGSVFGFRCGIQV